MVGVYDVDNGRCGRCGQLRRDGSRRVVMGRVMPLKVLEASKGARLAKDDGDEGDRLNGL